MAERFDFAGKKIWIPTDLAPQLLPPYVEVEMSLEELIDLTEDEYARIYYARSGRFLGIFDTREDADQADPYRYVRKLIPGGKLPWETDESNKGEYNGKKSTTQSSQLLTSAITYCGRCIEPFTSQPFLYI